MASSTSCRSAESSLVSRRGACRGSRRPWTGIEAVVRAGTADLTEALRWIEQIARKDSPSYERLVTLVRGGAPSADDMPSPGPLATLTRGDELVNLAAEVSDVRLRA